MQKWLKGAWMLMLGALLAQTARGDPSTDISLSASRIEIAGTVVLGKLTATELPAVADDTKPLQFTASGVAPGDFPMVICSPDANDVIFRLRENNRSFIWHRGKKSEPFDAAFLQDFSPDGTRTCYLAARPNDEHQYVFVNDVAQPAVISSEGTHWSPDSHHLAYFAVRPEDGSVALVLDGKASAQRFSNAWGPFFSPDSRHCMYNVNDLPGVGLIIDDGAPKGTFLGGGSERPFWSPDSKHTAMAGDTGHGWAMMRDGKIGEARYGRILDAVFSPDSQRIALVGHSDKGYEVFIDDKPVGHPFGGYCQGQLAFLPDGKSVHCLGSTSRGTFSVMIDGVKAGDNPAGDFAAFGLHHRFAPDGRRFAHARLVRGVNGAARPDRTTYTAGKEFNTRLVIDGTEAAVADDIWDIFFSQDSKRVASHLVVREHQHAMFVDGKQGKIYPFIPLQKDTFSPDSRHLAYIAVKPNGKAVLIVDDVEGPEFDGAVKGTPVLWLDNQRIRALVVSHSEIVSVTWKLSASAVVRPK